MGSYNVILFDLDGTLSDPREGIVRSIQYSLEKMNIKEADPVVLEGFIGPPLQQSFADYYGFNDAQIDRAMRFYRERFVEKGMYENELYAEVRLLLESLKDDCLTLVVATSKPTPYAEQILDYFRIKTYFDLVVGSNLDGTRTSKTEIIQHVIEHYPHYETTDFVMIGDRKHDMIGAQQAGIDSIGVTYGYGSLEELQKASPTLLVNEVLELKDILI